MDMEAWGFATHPLEHQPHCQINEVVFVLWNQVGILSHGRNSQARLLQRLKGDAMAEIEGNA
jgi:hypothetical protein